MSDVASGPMSETRVTNAPEVAAAKISPAVGAKPKKPAKPTLSLSPSTWFMPTCKLPGGTQSRDYSLELKASGARRRRNGEPPVYTFSLEQSLLQFGYDGLPDGLTLTKVDDQTAKISGSPEVSGTFTFTVKVVDTQGRTGSQKYSLAIGMDLERYYSYFDPLLKGEDEGRSLAPAGREICDFDPNDKSRFPLALCEFLAYKAAQAYNPADVIEKELLETAKIAQQKFDHFRFFDSNFPMSDGSAGKKAQTSDTPVPDRWFEGLEKRRIAQDQPLTRQEKKRLKKLEQTRKMIDTQAFGFVFENKAFIISRGTVSLRDWRIDLDSTLTDEITDREKFVDWLTRRVGLRSKSVQLTAEERILIGDENLRKGEAAGRHVGFATGWAAISDEVEAWVEFITGQNSGKPYRYVFAGHSLGGALSFTGAHAFALKGREIFAVITFGAPAVGRKGKKVKEKVSEAKDTKTAKKLNQDAREKVHFVDEYNGRLNLANRTIRLQAIPDAVPKVLELKGFAHVGRAWHLHFPPLPAPWTATRRRWITGPLLKTSQWLLRKNTIGRENWTTQVLSYAVLYGGPFIAARASAHSSESRYALFLSALSYRKIRAARTCNFLSDVTETGEAEKAEREAACSSGYEMAMADYEKHLDFIRGVSMKKTWLGKKIVRKKRSRPRMIPHHKKQLSLTKVYYGETNVEYIF